VGTLCGQSAPTSALERGDRLTLELESARVDLQRDEAETVTQNLVLHDRCVVPDIHLINRDGWDLSGRQLTFDSLGEARKGGAQPTSAIMTLRRALAMEASTPTKSNSMFDGVRRWTETTRFCRCGQHITIPTLQCGTDGRTHLLEPLQRPGVILAWIVARKFGPADLYQHQLRPRDGQQTGVGRMPGPGERPSLTAPIRSGRTWTCRLVSSRERDILARLTQDQSVSFVETPKMQQTV
jgi:hypothetical protein